MRVGFVRCPDYAPKFLSSAVERLLSLIGWPPADLLARPQRILIKPNLLADKPPAAAVTTHPEVVRAVIRILRRWHPRHEITVAESSACPAPLQQVWQATGFADMCAEENVPLVNLDLAGAKLFECCGVSFSIARPVLDADLVINVPKLKTHLLTTLTNAVKNMYGVIPGAQKAALHKKFPTAEMFGRFLAEFYPHVKPRLVVCDAVVGMEGNGPAAGIPVKLGFIAAAECSVALDLAVARMVGIERRLVPYFMPPLMPSEDNAIEYVGDFNAQTQLPPLKLPNTFIRRLIPAAAVRWLQPLLRSRPVFSEKCVRCGRCIKICPAAALTLPPTGAPSLKASKCIECGCCSEVCPAGAVAMRQGMFLRVVGYVRRKVLALLRQNRHVQS